MSPRDQGDYVAAHGLYHESLTINRELGDAWGLAYLLEDTGALAAREGHAARAYRLVGAAAALRETIGAPRSASEQTQLERNLEPARQVLGEADQAQAQAEGHAMSMEQAFEYARLRLEATG